jgi:hypothetical protein
MDAQVKLRGFRIELAEIEVVLNKQRGVREAVVVLREDEAGDPRLVAYVVRDRGQNISAESLTRELNRMLPDYMVPPDIVLLDTFPLTPHGKVDRRALPAPTVRHSKAQAEHVTLTPLEEVLTALVASVLRLDHVGPSDDFFRLGLTSLQATSIAREISDSLGIVVGVGTIFQHSTVTSLLVAIAADDRERATLERNAELLLRITALSEEDAEQLAAGAGRRSLTE